KLEWTPETGLVQVFYADGLSLLLDYKEINTGDTGLAEARARRTQSLTAVGYYVRPSAPPAPTDDPQGYDVDVDSARIIANRIDELSAPNLIALLRQAEISNDEKWASIIET